MQDHFSYVDKIDSRQKYLIFLPLSRCAIEPFRCCAIEPFRCCAFEPLCRCAAAPLCLYTVILSDYS